MSVFNSFVKCIFGRSVTDDVRARSQGGSNAQTIKEQVTADTSRVIKGPQRGGHFSYHLSVGAGSAPVGTLTVWYSNLPNPDPTSDADWVQDTTIGSVDLSVVANTFQNAGNVSAEHIRFKVTRTSGTLELFLWARVEGVDV